LNGFFTKVLWYQNVATEGLFLGLFLGLYLGLFLGLFLGTFVCKKSKLRQLGHPESML
jgi:Na+/H+ antiporter NhaA